MIRSFRSKRLRDQFEKGGNRFGAQSRKLEMLMDILDAVEDVAEIGDVAHLHQLTGDRKGTCAFHVTKNWRLTFRFEDGDAVDLDYEDHH